MRKEIRKRSTKINKKINKKENTRENTKGNDNVNKPSEMSDCCRDTITAWQQSHRCSSLTDESEYNKTVLRRYENIVSLINENLTDMLFTTSGKELAERRILAKHAVDKIYHVLHEYKFKLGN